MKKALLLKLKEALVSVLPVSLIVLLLNCTPLLNFSPRELIIFTLSSGFLILGIGLFSLGADVAMTPMGEHVGSGLTKSKNLLLLVAVCFVMGVLITVAEPDLTVLASQVAGIIDSTALIFHRRHWGRAVPCHSNSENCIQKKSGIYSDVLLYGDV